MVKKRQWFFRGGRIFFAAMLVAGVIMLFFGVLDFRSYEELYPIAAKAYADYHLKIEQIYALMLPYVESNDLGLNWYGCSSDITPWQEDAYMLLKELEAEYERIQGRMTSNAIVFQQIKNDYWSLSISIGGGSGRLLSLHYSPHGEFPEGQRLENMKDGWYFVASQPY